MFDYLEAHATENERKEGYDIADYLLKVKPDEAYSPTDDKEKSCLENTDRNIRLEGSSAYNKALYNQRFHHLRNEVSGFEYRERNRDFLL